MKLPIPVEFRGKIYTEMDLKEPSPNVLADTESALKKGQHRAVATMVGGVLSALRSTSGDIVDRKELEQAARKFPLRSAEVAVIYSLLERDEDDGIEGVYTCPRCGEKIVCEYVDEYDDTRDHIRSLKVVNCDSNGDQIAPLIFFELSSPVDIVTTDRETLRVSDIGMRHPTVADAMTVEAQIGADVNIKFQMALMAESLERINGEEVNRSFASSYGMMVMNKISRTDLIAISKMTTAFGIDQTVQKKCHECGKVWEEVVNTSNFFVSALDS